MPSGSDMASAWASVPSPDGRACPHSTAAEAAAAAAAPLSWLDLASSASPPLAPAAAGAEAKPAPMPESAKPRKIAGDAMPTAAQRSAPRPTNFLAPPGIRAVVRSRRAIPSARCGAIGAMSLVRGAGRAQWGFPVAQSVAQPNPTTKNVTSARKTSRHVRAPTGLAENDQLNKSKKRHVPGLAPTPPTAHRQHHRRWVWPDKRAETLPHEQRAFGGGASHSRALFLAGAAGSAARGRSSAGQQQPRRGRPRLPFQTDEVNATGR